MIRPVPEPVDYLDFECEECHEMFHHAERISHDAPAVTDAQKFDVRNWSIMRIHLKCPKCGYEDSYKLSLGNPKG